MRTKTRGDAEPFFAGVDVVWVTEEQRALDRAILATPILCECGSVPVDLIAEFASFSTCNLQSARLAAIINVAA
ncbi:MAG: hypothetical protein QOF51_2012 [Chloroflexota bacterium]|jgi:hypothetical protein|nr:hypothetical protein [Chloroflexota bacterium]